MQSLDVTTFPVIASGLHLVETKIHKSDMYGTIGEEITGDVIGVRVSSDIDRAGAKNHIDISAVGGPDLLPAGMWITPVQSIAREGIGVETVQRFAFELGQPAVTAVGVQFESSNTGRDIVDLLERSALLDTFYTPVQGWVMRDIEAAIRMLGITSLGANLLTNGGLENGGTGWTATHSGSGTVPLHAWSSTGIPTPEGTGFWHITFPGTTTALLYGYISQSNTPIPAGTKRLFVSGLYYGPITHSPAISVRFQNAAGTTLSSSTYIVAGDGAIMTPPPVPSAWTRYYAVGDVPEDAVTFTTYVFVRYLGGEAGNSSSAWDDIQVRPCTGDLLPTSMLALPANTTKATSRIQHLTSAIRLAAVNDRLAALGMMAVTATTNSKYTSRPARDSARDAVTRTYEIDSDIRVVGDIATERSTSNQYNRVFAIKEDFSAGTSMIAVAENKNLSDPWNIYEKQFAPKIVSVRDAVDMPALQAIADEELARASMQESVVFDAMPDPSLTVYDIIEITGPVGHPALGRWAIESMDGGLTAADSLVTIGARRTQGTG